MDHARLLVTLTGRGSCAVEGPSGERSRLPRSCTGPRTVLSQSGEHTHRAQSGPVRQFADAGRHGEAELQFGLTSARSRSAARRPHASRVMGAGSGTSSTRAETGRLGSLSGGELLQSRGEE